MKITSVAVLVFALLGAPAIAAVSPGAPVSFSFAAIPVRDFAQATFRDMLGRDYVISNDLLALDKRVSISVKGLEPNKVAPFVDRVLRVQGVTVQDRDGVFFLDVVRTGQAGDPASPGSALDKPPAPEVPDTLVVRLKHRAPTAMVELVNAAFGSSVARPAGGSSLVLVAPADRMKMLSRLVVQLDTPVPSVEVKASFIEVVRSEETARGVALVANAVSRRGLAVTLDPGTGSASFKAGSYELLLDALDGDGRFRQVSRSRIVGDELERLSLSVGDETPTLGRSSRDQAGNLVQDVVYRPSGVLLDVVARVLGSGRVSLQVDGQVSAFQSTLTGVENSPTLVKRQVKTALSLDDGEVLVIGGLDDSKVTETRSGFSFLPKSWGNRGTKNSSTELLLVLTANILKK